MIAQVVQLGNDERLRAPLNLAPTVGRQIADDVIHVSRHRPASLSGASILFSVRRMGIFSLP